MGEMAEPSVFPAFAYAQAFVARNDPQDRFVRCANRSSPLRLRHPFLNSLGNSVLVECAPRGRAIDKQDEKPERKKVVTRCSSQEFELS